MLCKYTFVPVSTDVGRAPLFRSPPKKTETVSRLFAMSITGLSDHALVFRESSHWLHTGLETGTETLLCYRDLKDTATVSFLTLSFLDKLNQAINHFLPRTTTLQPPQSALDM
ncbi:uncharacterized protein ACOB8E_019848 isoform 1-T1 [Sarcophilus harrisii]